MTFEELFVRASDPVLQQLVGLPGVRLLSRLDPGLTQPSKLRQVALGLKSPQEMLLDKETRNELLLMLSPREAEHLSNLLGLPNENDPFANLCDMRVQSGSRRYLTLLEYFSLEEVVPEGTDAKPSVERVIAGYPLFAHQRVAAEKTIELLDEEPKRAILHMPTGSGKTRTAMHVIAKMLNDSEPMLVIWLAHSQELCEQAVEEFGRAWLALGNRDVTLHRWWGDHTLDLDQARDGLLVAGLSKAYSASQRATANVGPLAGRAGLVVMDEAHQAVAPTYERILEFLTQAGEPTSLLGLTATPGRTWDDIDEDQRLVDYFFGRKVSLDIPGYTNPVEYLIDSGYLARPNYTSLHSNSGYDLSPTDLNKLQTELEIPMSVIRKLAEDEQRNLLIVNRVEEMIREHKRILVFSATVDHALLLSSVLRARGVDSDAVTGATPKDRRFEIIDNYRTYSEEPRVLVNYGVLTTGFDAPQTSAAIIARPTKSLVLYSQMVGRATRGTLAGGNTEADIVTVVDTGLPGFGSMSDAFENWEREWNQT